MHACLLADIFKGAVGFLVIERILLAFQAARAAHHRHAAKLAEGLRYAARLAHLIGTRRRIVYVEFEVAGNEKIKPAIAIVIAETRARAPAFARHAELFSDIRKRAVAVVVIQPRDAEVASIKIRPAIVIIIADGYAHAPALVGDAGFVRPIFKLP